MTDHNTIRTRARTLRREATEAERILWRAISARKIGGVRFNRQVVIGSFICDFASRGAKLVIEVDGGQHGWRTEEDARRTALIESHGYTVIRFWNNDVIHRIEGVILEIERALGAMPSPNPSREREGSF